MVDYLRENPLYNVVLRKARIVKKDVEDRLKTINALLPKKESKDVSSQKKKFQDLFRQSIPATRKRNPLTQQAYEAIVARKGQYGNKQEKEQAVAFSAAVRTSVAPKYTYRRLRITGPPDVTLRGEDALKKIKNLLEVVHRRLEEIIRHLSDNAGTRRGFDIGLSNRYDNLNNIIRYIDLSEDLLKTTRKSNLYDYDDIHEEFLRSVPVAVRAQRIKRTLRQMARAGDPDDGIIESARKRLRALVSPAPHS